jgi:hypothetical protein
MGSGVAAAVLCACGGGSAGDSGSTANQASPQPVAASNATVASTAAPDAVQAAQPSPLASADTSGYLKAIAAARNAAATDPLCDPSVMGDFYWEIGVANNDRPIAANAEGGGTVTASSYFNIASASKFVFGAYVLEKKGIDAVRNNSSLYAGMRFMSGYTGLDDSACAGSGTVGNCFTSGMSGNTSQPDPNTVGKFDYDGGHDQKLAAVDLGMGDFTARQVAQEYQAVLGLPASMGMAPLDPLMAGGVMASASDYAQFLRKIMRGQYVISAHLGEDSVCALWSACPDQVAYSPIAALGEPWRYSYNHWVESEHGNGTVDAYSSPGKWGFYPWITPDRKFYGIVSRHDTQPAAYGVSVKCGRQIRKAFLSALPSGT